MADYVAEDLQALPNPVARFIALGASSAFIFPLSPINTLVITAGNCSFVDFIRRGAEFRSPGDVRRLQTGLR